MPEQALPSTDGRVRRSERSRAAIVDAVLELVSEGVLLPTAQQIAERAGVGIRSVFRHYTDMESLFEAMSERWRSEAQSFLARPPENASVEDRALALVRRRAALFERFAPIQRSKLLLVWKSEGMRLDQEAGIAALRHERQRWLPEVDDVDPAIVEALEATTSFAHWNQLREAQKLEGAELLAALEVQVLALLRAARLAPHVGGPAPAVHAADSGSAGEPS